MNKSGRKDVAVRLNEGFNIQPPPGARVQAYDCVLFGKCNCSITLVANIGCAPVAFLGTGTQPQNKHGDYLCLVCGATWDHDWVRARTRYVHSLVPGSVGIARTNKRVMEPQ